MKTELAHVMLADIEVSKTNDMFRDQSELQTEALDELINSIREKGVIQPVLLRKGKKKKYELVCGERRYRASLSVNTAFKDRNNIPAYIRDLSDEEALDLQLTENLQRKDVHPLKEARAYKFLIEKDPKKNTTAELAVRFGKGETYILQRLKLNDLIQEIMNDFESGKLGLAQALLIARLQPGDQKGVKKECIVWGSQGQYKSPTDIQFYIERSVTRSLSSAPFKIDDATLLPKAGACTLCPKRSGANQLFADVKDKDRCFDGKCFSTKHELSLLQVIRETVEKKPDLVLLMDYYSKATPELDKLLKELEVKPLKEGKDFNTWNSRGKAMKGLWIVGHKAGKFESVYSEKEKPKKESSGKTSKSTEVKEAVAGIQERTKRAAELDDEKIFAKVVTAMQAHAAAKGPYKLKVIDAERAFMNKIIYDALPWGLRDKFDKVFKLNGDDKKEAEAFKKLTPDHTGMMVRALLAHKSTAPYLVRSPEGYLMMEAAAHWGVPVSNLQKEQAEIRKKREARSKERIKDLQASLKAKSKK